MWRVIGAAVLPGNVKVAAGRRDHRWRAGDAVTSLDLRP